MTNQHKETTAHIRNRIRVAGISARCRGFVSCGRSYIQVNVPSYDVEFTEQEQCIIRSIAQVNHLTGSHGLPIDVARMTNPKSFDFEFIVKEKQGDKWVDLTEALTIVSNIKTPSRDDLINSNYINRLKEYFKSKFY